MVDGRYVYLCTPEYMASYARRFIAAGVTRRRRLLRHDARPHPEPGALGAHASQPSAGRSRCVAARRDAARRRRRRSRARQKSAAGPRSMAPEVRGLGRARPAASGADPGRDHRARAQYCKENEVDAINVADGPRASARMSAQSLCLLLQEQVGIDTILHYTCRDRNLLGIQSDLLGAHALGPAQHSRDHRRPAQARRLPGRDRGLRRRLDRPHPHHGPPQPRLRPGRQR